MTLNVTNLIGFGGRAQLPLETTFIDSAVSSADQISYTFSSKSFGAASADRRIVVCAAYRHGSAAISGITVGGVSCTINSGTNIFVAPSGVAMGIAHVPTGTTGNIVVTFPSTAAGCGIGWWVLENLQSETPVDTVENRQTPSSTLDLTGLATAKDGVAIYAAMDEGNTRTFTWSNPTERYDEVVDGGLGFTHTGADASTTGATINETLAASGGTVLVGVGASFL